MVAEEQDRRRVVNLRVFADVVLEKDCCHGRYVLMTKAQVGTCETSIPRFHLRHSHFAVLIDHVSRKYLLRQGHRPGTRSDRRKKDLLLQARHIEWEKTAVLDHLPRNFIFALRERSEEHTSELQSHVNLVCRLLLEKKKKTKNKL